MEVAYSNSGSQFQVLNWERFNSALILEVKRDTQSFTSTAVAIGKRFLLTAAHRVDQFDSGRLILESHYINGEGIKRKLLLWHLKLSRIVLNQVISLSLLGLAVMIF